MPIPRPSTDGGGRREAFTLLEILFVLILMLVILGGLLNLFQVGSRSVVVTTDHAVARDEAISILHAIAQDLDRIIIADDFDRTTFPNVIEPILIKDSPQSSSFMFYAFHHRIYHWEDHRMELVGQRIEYQVRPTVPGKPEEGVDLWRNDEDTPINRIPLTDVLFERLPDEEAEQLSVSPFHAVRVVVKPRGFWDKKNDRLAEFHPQTRLFHLKGVESQFAVLLSLKEAGAGPYYKILSDPRLKVPERLAVYSTYKLDQVPLDWLRPRGIVTLSDDYFDYATAGQNSETGTPGTPVPPPTMPPPPDPGASCDFCTTCPVYCPACNNPGNEAGVRCVCNGCGGTECKHNP